MSSLRGLFKLPNTDLRWYRDKYLAYTFFICVVCSLSLLWGWPPPHKDLIYGLGFLGAAAICVAITPQRFAVLGGGLTIVSARGIIGGVLNHSPGPVIVGLLAGTIVYFMLKHQDLFPPLNYKIKQVGLLEVLIDIVVMGSSLFASSKLVKLVGKLLS